MQWLVRLRKWLLRGVVSAPLLLIVLAGSNLWSYHRLTHEAAVADIAFEKLGPERYRATLSLPDGQVRHYVLRGDEWQLDARVIKWKGWANLLGLDAAYRLERLAGRYSDPIEARNGPRSIHQLAPASVLDLWMLARRHGDWLPLVDSAYGSSVYLPMGNDRAYHVTISQTGLLARPATPPKEHAD